ncbi:5-methylcytosine-specific restriction protein A [Variovorax boronicumulans]|uniref:HNH endonuclease n=1 Tax=Variovorax boronicumulans TaxID=436515 RepID=UPI00277DF358|nr:5-methylcytosine-specific restriction protein A [Variovorax boronicumulans]
MKLTTLKSRVGQAPSRLATLTQRPGSTPRLRGRAAVQRRERWLLAHPYCVECKQGGRIVAAVVPDHITPLWQGGADDDTNLQSLCQEHHDEKTAREAAERARGG